MIPNMDPRDASASKKGARELGIHKSNTRGLCRPSRLWKHSLGAYVPLGPGGPGPRGPFLDVQSIKKSLLA